MSPEILITIIVGSAIFIGMTIFIIKKVGSSKKIEAATKAIKLQDYDKAISSLKVLVSKNDSNSETHFLLGECYFLKKNYEWALPEYKKVLRLNKYEGNFTEASVRLRLADIYLHFNQLEEAQAEFVLVTKLDPNNYKSFFEIGKIYVERQHFDKAGQYIKKSLEINPNHNESLFYSGMIKYHVNLYSEALLDLEKAVRQEKNMFRANYYIGMVNYKVKNLQKALEQLEIGSRDKDYKMKATFQKGVIHNEMGKLDEAIAEMQKAVSYINEEDNIARNIRYQLANCYELKKDISAAIDQWEKITASQQDFKDVQSKLANYSELRMEDSLKDFFVASNEMFEHYCRQVLKKMGLEPKERVSLGSVMAVFYANEPLGSKDVRMIRALVRVYRSNEPLGDKVIRDLVEAIKQEQGISKGVCISATGFSKQAIEWAESRPVRLVDSKELSELLKGSN